MSETQPLPTNAEIDELLESPGDINWVIADARGRWRLFARAVLAKWGTPAPVGVEPVATVFTMEALAAGGGVKYHATVHEPLPAGTKLYTAAQVLAMGPMTLKPLEWSEERQPNEDSCYNHVVAKSPLGKILIEWKGWKEDDSRAVSVDGSYLDYAHDLEGAKLVAEQHLLSIAKSLIAAHEVPDYSEFFYALARLLDIPAQSISPERVWQEQMLPKISAALAAAPSQPDTHMQELAATNQMNEQLRDLNTSLDAQCGKLERDLDARTAAFTTYKQSADADILAAIATILSLEGENEALRETVIRAQIDAALAGTAPEGQECGNCFEGKSDLDHICPRCVGTHPQPAAQAGEDAKDAARWVDLPGALPEPGKPVLLDIGKKFPIRAMWAAKHTVEAHDEAAADDWGEYDEATDTYYCPEGWYEWNQHEETHWAVSETPVAWCALPPPSSAKGVAHG